MLSAIHRVQFPAVGFDEVLGLHDEPRRAKGNDAMVEEHDTVEVTGGLVEVVRGDHDGHFFLLEAVQQVRMPSCEGVSRPVSGSSINISSASCARARAMNMRCCCPPES